MKRDGKGNLEILRYFSRNNMPIGCLQMFENNQT